jgi:hypothetical protein
MSINGERRRFGFCGGWLRSAKGRAALSAIALSLIAVYLASIVTKEAVEGHISTSRSWFASVVIGGLALLAVSQATRCWRKAKEPQRPSREGM